MFKLFLADSWQINVYPLHLIDLSISNVCIYICTHTLTHTHTHTLSYIALLFFFNQLISTMFPCTLPAAEVPPDALVPRVWSQLHTSAVSEVLVKCYPVRSASERDRSLVHYGKSQGDTAQHVYCLGQLMAVKCSGPKFVVVSQKKTKEKKKIPVSAWGSELRELSHRVEREIARSREKKSIKGGRGWQIEGINFDRMRVVKKLSSCDVAVSQDKCQAEQKIWRA